MNDNELQLFSTEETISQPILFEGKYIRHEWVKEEEDWFFSVADVVEVLTDSLNPSDYIKKMKKRDPELAKGWVQIVTPPFRWIRQEDGSESIAQMQRKLA